MGLENEIRARHNNSVKTVDDLWVGISQDPDHGIRRAARLLHHTQLEFITILAAEAVRDSTLEVPAPFWQRYLSVLWVLLLPLCALLIWGARSVLPAPFGLPNAVVITARNINMGDTLGPQNLGTERLAVSDVFTDTQQLYGLSVTHPISADVPIRFQDVLQPHVLAVQDIPSGMVITSSAISVTWSAYELGAVTDTSSVVGYTAQRAIQHGEVILSDFIAAQPVSRTQVVVTAPGGMPGSHFIGANEVQLEYTRTLTDALTSLNDVVGGYLLQQASQGDILTTTQIVSATLLAGRQLLPITATIVTSSGASAPKPGDHLLLRVDPSSPPAPSAASTPSVTSTPFAPFIIRDVILLTPISSDGSEVVAVLPADATTLTPLLVKSTLSLMQSLQ